MEVHKSCPPKASKAVPMAKEQQQLMGPPPAMSWAAAGHSEDVEETLQDKEVQEAFPTQQGADSIVQQPAPADHKESAQGPSAFVAAEPSQHHAVPNAVAEGQEAVRTQQPVPNAAVAQQGQEAVRTQQPAPADHQESAQGPAAFVAAELSHAVPPQQKRRVRMIRSQ